MIGVIAAIIALICVLWFALTAFHLVGDVLKLAWMLASFVFWIMTIPFRLFRGQRAPESVVVDAAYLRQMLRAAEHRR